MSEPLTFHRAYRFRLRSNRKAEVFRCRSCGHTDHADVNAAKNILAAGHAVLAGDGHALAEGQVQSGCPVKREPTEGRRHAA